jgi:hypothetical protein
VSFAGQRVKAKGSLAGQEVKGACGSGLKTTNTEGEIAAVAWVCDPSLPRNDRQVKITKRFFVTLLLRMTSKESRVESPDHESFDRAQEAHFTRSTRKRKKKND